MKAIMNNILSFVGYAWREKMVLFSLLGYILLMISPQFSWLSSELQYTGVNEEYSFNMFQLAGGSIDEKGFIALGIFTILNAIGFIAIEFMDYKMKLRSRLSLIKIIEAVLYIGLVVILVIALNNHEILQMISYRKGEIEVLEYWIKDAKGYCNNGVGPVLFIAGLAVAILSKVGIYIFYFVTNVKESLAWKK